MAKDDKAAAVALEKKQAAYDELVKYEEVIVKGKDTFIVVGEALASIRDGKLYKLSGHTEGGYKTFEAYCQERWGFGAAYARRQIAASETAKSAPTGALSGKTEREVRPLTKHRNNPEALAKAIEEQKTPKAGPVTTTSTEPAEHREREDAPSKWTTDELLLEIIHRGKAHKLHEAQSINLNEAWVAMKRAINAKQAGR